MAATLKSSMEFRIAAALVQPVFELSSTQNNIAYSRKISLSNGIGADQADLEFQDVRTLVTATSENLDLSGTSLSSPFGVAIAFTKIKGIYIENRSPTNSLIIGGAASNAWLGFFNAVTDKIKLLPGTPATTNPAKDAQPSVLQMICPGAGWPVTAATADLLKIAHGGEDGTSLDYAIILIGVS